MLGQKGSAPEALMTLLDDVITREVGRGERLSQKGVEIREGQYDFLDLHRWQQQMSPDALALPGVVFTDIDDMTNRLRIGITDLPGGMRAVEELLSTVGVPREAVLISETKPVFPALRNRRRPLRGGLQINFRNNLLCSLGFIADRQGIRGFVTNSHCTTTQGGVEGTVYHQPIANSSNNEVGVEIADPFYFTGGSCPPGRRCRFSDSAFVRATTNTSVGTIARPPIVSINWNGVDIFTNTGEVAPLVGQSVTKVGRTTGRTSGTVQQTCAPYNVADTDITLLCQSRATYSNALGDSGSPVFRITSTPIVNLGGIHWGMIGGVIGVFSPITNIQMSGELGPISTCFGGC
jgi:hypothetical protein